MKKLILFAILSFLFITNVVLAQENDTIAISLSDTFSIADTADADTIVVEENREIDEDLNDIFSEKIDSASNAWNVNNILGADSLELQHVLDFPKNLPDSVYVKRLMEAEQVINLSYNKVVRNFIQMYTEKKRNQVEMMLGVSEYYFPKFEEVLDKYNLPLELKYLPIIESALNPTAMSKAGANGLWQFMYATAKSMKLEITSFVDERRDPVKSTEAAAMYLQQLYNTYGDWHLAIAAYNCGPGNVNKAIRRSGGKTNYWEIYYRLPRETRGYVPAFIAATYVMNYYEEHLLTPLVPEIAIDVDTILINKYVHFNQVAEVLNMDKAEISALNPMFRRNVIPAKTDKTYPLVLPQDKIMEFIDKDTTVFAWDREKYFPNNTLIDPTESSSTYFTPADVEGKAKVVYTVQTGDNVGYISSWFNVRQNDLRYWNNISRNLIRVGQKLAIYVAEKDKTKYEQVAKMTFAEKQASIGKSTTTTTKPKETEPLDPQYEYYTVKKGDNIWDIAQKYAGITSDEIIRLNDISNERGLYVGQKLKIKIKT
ncbi:MAG: transglycosylase SLT domain-containing protein [Prolixibacteraceae bacterium]|nr:transglycosylase SLT domain-containing protein [Prolixibacteraceae bacterium]